ncbi:hypothetical protein [Sphingomonas rubra]|uniref:Uncharacterized protein n=1 Tax=Sphingomonas rubra TaxID=634430 RepID=A0A1I5UAD5_9SPHN|nr:hypothetical protein [Sphingomonas rubra]SFP92172.1 hypothetical protein SAMN04488241_1119 [Sphingomonas rubra]
MANKQPTRNKQAGVQALLGLGAFAAGAVAWVVGTGRYGDRLAALAKKLPAAPKLGAVPGDRTTAPAASPSSGKPADMAAAPVGMAETDKRFQERPGSPAAEHVPTDLLADAEVTATTRAPEAFRPDPTAVPTAEERESLRPATGPAPTLSADRGSGFSEGAGAA